MKTDIHPKTHPVVFIDTSCGAEFVAQSTLTSKETKKINGVDHHVIKVEVSSSSHPFYTGKRTLLDSAGRVDKFMAKVKKAQAHKAKLVKEVDEDEEINEDNEVVEETEKTTEKGEAAESDDAVEEASETPAEEAEAESAEDTEQKAA